MASARAREASTVACSAAAADKLSSRLATGGWADGSERLANASAGGGERGQRGGMQKAGGLVGSMLPSHHGPISSHPILMDLI